LAAWIRADDFTPGDHSSGLGLFSIRGITAFFVGFGWTGIIALKAGYSLTVAIIFGILAGGILMGGMLVLLRTLLGLQSSGTLDYANAIGQIGTAYTTIPPNQKAGGQVEVLIQGRLSMAEALNASLVHRLRHPLHRP